MHFAALALLIFAAYAVLAPPAQQAPVGSIVVSSGKIDQMAAIFARTWQRPPGPDELKGLIDDYVKEEIYVREALALGLDKDDVVIRRRLRQKMEFMTDADVDALAPSDTELQTYLDAHPDVFAERPQFAFQQVFLNPDKHRGTEESDASALLAVMRSNPGADPATAGDASLLPPEQPLTDIATIGSLFGPDVADAMTQAEPGVWTGPVASPFGLHLIRVTARQSGRVPPLAEIRDAVQREWANARRQEIEAQRLADLISRYTITIEAAPKDSVTQ